MNFNDFLALFFVAFLFATILLIFFNLFFSIFHYEDGRIKIDFRNDG